MYPALRHAHHVLAALEDGRLDDSDVRILFQDEDPALIHLVISWLRAHYPPGHSASEGVLGRVVSLMQGSPAVARRAREGARDPVVAWFEEAHDYGALRRDEFLEIVVDKLES